MMLLPVLLILSIADVSDVSAVYVDGNNEAASRIRAKLRDGYECLELATRRDEADAVLTVQLASRERSGTIFGTLGRMGEDAVSALLETPDGGYLWDRTQRAVGLGVNVAADETLKQLARAAECKERRGAVTPPR